MRTLQRYVEHEETDSEGSWAISYGDMVTLLLAFFILFFTIDPKKNAGEQMQQILMKSLTPEGQSSAKGFETRLTSGTADAVGLDPQILKKWNGVAHQVGNQILIEFGQVSFFKSGETEVTAEGKKALGEFVKVFMPFAGNYTLGIRAYTDRRPVSRRHRFHDNLELSALRSVSTMRSLQASGLPLSQITLGGYGELRMTADELNQLRSHDKTLSELDLSRKVVLVVQPATRNGL